MYRVLLVDDEAEIREGIKAKINWEDYGFVLVGDTENGKDALDMALKMMPDVVMTDIKMPFMSGLELCKILSKRMPSVKLLIFSGFDDFEYAKEAIKTNVCEYILKPVDAKELTEVLIRMKSLLDKETQEFKNITVLRQHYIDSIPVLAEQLLIRLIEGRGVKSDVISTAKQYNLDMDFSFYAVAVTLLEEPTKGPLTNEAELALISAKKLIYEHLNKNYKCQSLIYHDKVVTIIMFNNSDEINFIIDIMTRICNSINRFLEISCVIGIGGIISHLKGISLSYKEAISAIDYRALFGSNQAFYIEDMEPIKTASIRFDETDERELLMAVKLGSDTDIKQVVEKLVDKLVEFKLPINQYQFYLIEILTVLINLARNYKFDIEEIFGKDLIDYTHISKFDSITDIKNMISDICLKINILIKDKRHDTTKLMIEKAKEFVKDNFMDSEISVEMLCGYLHMSPAYFSTLFKKETGTSFVNYLTKVRMDEAAKLLNDTEEKTYIISESVGYTDPNYFSYVFKRHFGVSPSKYRKNE